MNTKTQLRKAYTKRLNSLNKSFFKDSNSGLKIFVEHLKFKRDNLILESTNENALAIVATAVAEFETYQATEDTKQKEFHWNNFWDLARASMEEQQIPNDTV